METTNPDNYVLVLEDRSQTQSAGEAGKLSVVSSIDKNGKISTVAPLDANSTAFMKFKRNDSLLQNFFSNLAKQFKDPSHIGVYRLLADKVEDSVNVLRKMLENREAPGNKTSIGAMRVTTDDFAPTQKASAINFEQVDWKEMERLGLSQEKLKESGNLEKILKWQKSDLLTIAIPLGETTIYTEARIALRHSEDDSLGLSIHPLRKEPQLDFPYMGYRFSDEDKETLRHSGNLGKLVELTPKNGEPFKAYISIDPQTNEIVALKADRVSIPQEIKGVLLTPEQKPETRHGVPGVICGLALSERQQKALSDSKTLYLKNMTDKEGQSFNAYVRMDKEQNRPRFYRWNPDKKEGKVEAVAEENKTQVAVNNEGKTIEV